LDMAASCNAWDRLQPRAVGCRDVAKVQGGCAA
jgi:hypothetical protein